MKREKRGENDDEEEEVGKKVGNDEEGEEVEKE